MYGQGHLKSAIRSNKGLTEIQRWVEDLTAGRNPGGGVGQVADLKRSKTGSTAPTDKTNHKKIGPIQRYDDPT